MNPHARSVHPVLIIGAGLSGLALAYELERLEVPTLLLEQARDIAEPWRSRYPELRLNTHRHYSHLPGRALPREAGAFASRDTVIRYLKDYASRFDGRIVYGQQVKRIDPVDGIWQIRTSGDPWHARHVVIATGRERVPVIPDWPGASGFDGELIHAARFANTQRYRDQRVLVVGAGNSGIDVLNHLIHAPTADLRLSVRSGTTILPMYLFGIPVQRLSGLMDRLPLRLIDTGLLLTEWLAFGNLRRVGVPGRANGAATHLAQKGVVPAFDNGFVRALKEQRVSIVPPVQAFDGPNVLLLDDRRLRMDAVICATGYSPSLEGLVGHLDVLDAEGIPISHADAALPGLEGLWFMGMRPRLQGSFHAACVDGRRLARRISRDLHDVAPRASRAHVAVSKEADAPPSQLTEQ